MADKKLTVVISQGQSKNPRQRQLEEELAMHLMLSRNVEVSLVPHLYDMAEDHTGMLFLKGIPPCPHMRLRHVPRIRYTRLSDKPLDGAPICLLRSRSGLPFDEEPREQFVKVELIEMLPDGVAQRRIR